MLERKEAARRQLLLGHPLTKCTVVSRAVDLDPVAHDHQVGGHLCALVRLHLDVVPELTKRQLLQIAHPLACGGFHDRKLAHTKADHGESDHAPRDSPPQSVLLPHPHAAGRGQPSPRDPSGGKFPEVKSSFPGSRKRYSSEGPFLFRMAACLSCLSRRPRVQHRSESRESVQLVGYLQDVQKVLCSIPSPEKLCMVCMPVLWKRKWEDYKFSPPW